MELTDPKSPLLIEMFEGTNLMRRATCKPCRLVIFNITRETPKADVERETLGFKAHLEIVHDLAVDFFQCQDPNCVQRHEK